MHAYIEDVDDLGVLVLNQVKLRSSAICLDHSGGLCRVCRHILLSVQEVLQLVKVQLYHIAMERDGEALVLLHLALKTE